MKKLIEKNAIDEDFRKDTYAPTLGDDAIPAAIAFGFKKRAAKTQVKKRKAEVSDGETN